MSNIATLKIENDDFFPRELHLCTGDELQIHTAGFIPPGQIYSLLSSEISNPIISPLHKFTKKFTEPTQFTIKCKEKVWMSALIIVNSPILLAKPKDPEPPIIIQFVPNFGKTSKQLTASSITALNTDINHNNGNPKTHTGEVVEYKQNDKKKHKEKKIELKFKRKLRTNKEVLEEVVRIICDLKAFGQKTEEEEEKERKLVEYLTIRLEASKITLPGKYKDSLVKFILTSTDSEFILTHTAPQIISGIFGINIQAEHSPKGFSGQSNGKSEHASRYFSSLSITKTEHLLETRKYYIGWTDN